MQLITLLLSSFLAYFVRCDTKLVENSLVNSGNGSTNSPLFWRSVIGDICQLPSIPRPTTDPNKYVECVYQADNAGNRTDLGIWMSKECPDGYHFVAPALQCKTVDSIKAQQQLCDGPDAEKYEFCPESEDSLRFVVNKVERQMEQCSCPKGEENCECPKVVVIELVPYNGVIANRNTSKVRKARHVICQGQQGCVIPSENCDCSGIATICVCSSSASTYPTGVTQPTSQQIPPGCQLLSNGQLYCPQAQGPITPQQQPQPQPQFQPQPQPRPQQPQQQQPTVIAPQPCPLVAGQGIQNAQYQGICSWMIDPLVADPQSPAHFLQCQPAANSLFCGRWQRMPCEPGLIFNAQLQVCVWSPSAQPGNVPAATQVPGMIPAYPSITQLPYTSTGGYSIAPAPMAPGYGISECNCGVGILIGACGTSMQCPGQSICKSSQMTGKGPCSVCCYYSKGAI